MHNAYDADQDTREFIKLVESRKKDQPLMFKGHWTPPTDERGGILTTDELVAKSLPSVTECIKAELMAMLAELEQTNGN
jgi:hypothetical protein